MLDKLPTELSLHVLRTAATELRFTNRQSVVNLVLASSTVYEIVAPILYDTIILSPETRDRIGPFTHDDNESTRAIAKRVCSHVRVLVDDGGDEKPVNPKLLLNVVNVLAAAEYVRDIAGAQCEIATKQTGPPLREITITSVDFKTCISWIPSLSRDFITHMTGFLPIFNYTGVWTTFFSSSDLPAHGPERWTRSIIDVMPALTHLGLVLVVYNENRGVISAFDLEALGKALRAALAVPRLKRVVLKVCGGYVERRREEIETVLHHIPDSRLGVVWEERPLKDWDEYDEWNREDTVAGRSIWTCATPVYAIS